MTGTSHEPFLELCSATPGTPHQPPGTPDTCSRVWGCGCTPCVSCCLLSRGDEEHRRPSSGCLFSNTLHRRDHGSLPDPAPSQVHAGPGAFLGWGLAGVLLGSLFSLPALLIPCFPVQYLEEPPRDVPHCLGAAELELLGTGNVSGVERSWSAWIVVSVDALLPPGDVAQPLCPRLPEVGTRTGTFPKGVAKTPQGAGAGWVLPCPWAGGVEAAPATSSSPCANWEGTGGTVAVWRVRCCLGEWVLLGWAGLAFALSTPHWKDAPSYTGPRREPSEGHRATSPWHAGKGRLASAERMTGAVPGGRGTGFTLQTEA